MVKLNLNKLDGKLRAAAEVVLPDFLRHFNIFN